MNKRRKRMSVIHDMIHYLCCGRKTVRKNENMQEVKVEVKRVKIICFCRLKQIHFPYTVLQVRDSQF